MRTSNSMLWSGAREPSADPLHRLVHLRRRARIAEADEVPSLDRIEIDAGRDRHVGLLQHALGEIEAVVAEARHIGIEIERAVDRENPLDAGLRQTLQQDAPVLLV